MKLTFVTALAAVAFLVAGCDRPITLQPVVSPVASTVDYCRTANPVRVSRADTRGTKEQADREYRKYVAACGGPPPA